MLLDSTKLSSKKCLISYLLVLFHFLFINFQLLAQTTNIEIETGKYKPEQIIFVRDILQDKQGFLWIAAENGLFKYDGYNFTHYTYNTNDTNSISFNRLRCIAEDKFGKIWVGTENGLNCFNPETEDFKRFYADTTYNSISGNIINKIHIDNEDKLWLISEYGGLDKINLITGQISNFMFENDNNLDFQNSDFKDIISDNSEILWILGEKKGLKSFDKNKETFQTYTDDSIYPNNKYYDEGLSLEIDDDILWIGTSEKGIGQFNITHKKFNKPAYEQMRNYDRFNDPGFGVTSISKTSDNFLWFSSRKHGVFKLLLKKQGIFKDMEELIHYSPNKQAVYEWIPKIYRGGDGVVWVGGKGNGLMSIFPKHKKISYYRNIEGVPSSLGFKSVRTIFEDNDGILWISGYIGFDIIDRKTNKYTHIKDSIYYEICQDMDSSDILWLGHARMDGFSKLNKKTFTFKNSKSHPEFRKIGESAFSIIEHGDGTLWLGTDLGLRKYHKTTHQVTYYNHEPNNANSIVKGEIKLLVKDSYGKIWCRTDNNGLSCFDPQTETFENYINIPDNPYSIGANSIYSIYEDKNKTLWIGTGGGLNRFNRKDKSFTRYIKEAGFPANKIVGILEDKKSNLWMSSEAGIIKFNPLTNDFKLYDMSDGLLSLEFQPGAHYVNKQGEMFFGSIKGIVSFFPEEMKDNPYRPPVVLTLLKIFYKDTTIGKHISTLDTLDLSYKDEIISFEFAALNFIKPEKNQYKYKLEGANNDWIDLGIKRDITFTNLDPGTYILRVIASNNDGVWNEDGCSLHIIINPPWWLTWWAKTLWGILIVGLFLSIYFTRVSSLKKQKQKLAQQVKERTAEVVKQKEEIQTQAEELQTTNDKLIELDQFKEGMTGMIVHDLKNPLNAIINAPKFFSFEKQVTNMKQAGKQMLNMVMNILDVHKYEETQMVVDKSNYSLYELSQNAMHEVIFLAERKNILIKNGITLKTGVQADKEIIERVFVNLLSNAIKYTPNNGNITLSATENPESGLISVSITDTGQGIPQDQFHKVFDKFTQVQAKKSGKVHSTGLGLTFCKMAIEAHDGKIGVESEPGTGTTFWFTLPAGEKRQYFELTKTSTQENTKLELTELDKNYLKTYIADLQNLLVYETSEIKEILNKIDTENSETLKKWKYEMEQVLFTMSEEKYKEIIDLIS